jgi:hypothetical protein
VTDDPPSVARFTKYYSPCNTSGNDWYGTNTSRDNCSTSGTIRYHSPLDTTIGPNEYCAQAVQSMSSNKATILSGIATMQSGGDTHIDLGMAWGWRMLSPRWRGLWGDQMNTDSLPLDYRTALMNKVVILMTDGDNHYSSGNYTAYGYLSSGRLGTTNGTTAASRLDTRTAQVCDSLKANGVLVYTVALGTAISSAGQNLLRDCATGPSYYYNSPTTDDLRAAFHQIADSLGNLRISR